MEETTEGRMREDEVWKRRRGRQVVVVVDLNPVYVALRGRHGYSSFPMACIIASPMLPPSHQYTCSSPQSWITIVVIVIRIIVELPSEKIHIRPACL